LSFLAFISLGLPDGLLGVAWPSVRANFALPISQLGGLLLASMGGYLALSFLSGALVARLGVAGLLVLSSVAVVVSLGGYALAPTWPVMVLLGVVSGAGAGAIDAGLNAYAARHFSHRVMNWMHACYGVGAVIGPLVMTAVLQAGASWRLGYGIVAVAMIGMTVSFVATRRLWNDGAAPGVVTDAPGVAGTAGVAGVAPGPVVDASGADGGATPTAQRSSLGAALRRPAVWAGIVLFFVYVGIEFTAGQWAYSLMTEGRGVSPRAAGIWVSLYYAGLTAGRVAFGAIAAHVAASALLRLGLIGAVASAALIWWNPATFVGLAALPLLGFALAPIFPLLMSETPGRVGRRDSDHAVGFQISAASLGGAALPAVAGLLAKARGLEALGPYLLAATVVLLVLHEAVQARAKRPA
jgi:fucose permease